MLRIVADDKIPFLKGVLEPFARVDYLPGREITRNRIHDADALLIRTRTRCDAALLEGTNVRFIATATIGYDHIDTGFCDEKGIKWESAPGCNASSVGQYIASVLHTLARIHGFQLKDKTLGIIGVGNVGTKVERFALLSGMNVLLNDPPRERNEKPGRFVSLQKLLPASDIVTLHVPLNKGGLDNTYHLIDSQALSMMKPGAWLINSARGEVVPAKELSEALRSRASSDRNLAGAVLDVWEGEPHPDPGLLALTAIATPHIAGYSVDGKANGTGMAVGALSRFFGLPLAGWFPQDIPEPSHKEFNLSCRGRTEEEIVREAVLRTYDVMRDDSNLRSFQEDFESLREHYPVRREFPAFTVHPTDADLGTKRILSELGFRVL